MVHSINFENTPSSEKKLNIILISDSESDQEESNTEKIKNRKNRKSLKHKKSEENEENKENIKNKQTSLFQEYIDSFSSQKSIDNLSNDINLIDLCDSQDDLHDDLEENLNNSFPNQTNKNILKTSQKNITHESEIIKNKNKNDNKNEKENYKPNFETNSNLSSLNESKKSGNDKNFKKIRENLAFEFACEVDQLVMDSKLGVKNNKVKITWSKTLNTTAGRARLLSKKNQLQFHKHIVGLEQIEKQKDYHAEIELSIKVVDNQDKLKNTIAHELCHIACWIISLEMKNPHGKIFKQWATKASTVLKAKGVLVTTKHSYEIAYRYKWKCISCETEYGRHSKSINPETHRCGKCKGRLEQTLPAKKISKLKNDENNSENQITNEKNISDYQQFIKNLYKSVRNESSGKSHKQTMDDLSKMWREKKIPK